MQFSIFKIFQIFGIVSNWAVKALADGKVTLEEAVDLVKALCGILGVTPALEIPGAQEIVEEVVPESGFGIPDSSKETDAVDPDRGPPLTVSPKIDGGT